MTEPQFGRENFRREVLAFHGLPVAAALAFVAIFLTVFLLSGSYLFSSLVAVIPSMGLMWRWGIAGRRIDRWGCPSCKQPFPKKMFWTYPPRVCPSCGKSAHE